MPKLSAYLPRFSYSLTLPVEAPMATMSNLASPTVSGLAATGAGACSVTLDGISQPAVRSESFARSARRLSLAIILG